MQLIATVILTIIILYVWSWLLTFKNFFKHGVKTGNWEPFIGHVTPYFWGCVFAYLLLSYVGCF